MNYHVLDEFLIERDLVEEDPRIVVLGVEPVFEGLYASCRAVDLFVAGQHQQRRVRPSLWGRISVTYAREGGGMQQGLEIGQSTGGGF